MSNLITDWRVAVQTHLADRFPDADVRGGEETSVNRRGKDLICVWWPGWPTLQRDISLANPTLLVRYFPSRSRQPNAETPVDESPLEQAAADLMAAFVGKRKAGDFVENLACYVSVCIPDKRAWCVNVTLQAVALNLAVTAA